MNKPQLRFKGFDDEWTKLPMVEAFSIIPFKPYISSPSFGGKYPIIQQGNSPILGYSSQNPCIEFEGTLVIGDHTMSVYQPKLPFLVASDGVKILKSTRLSADFFYYFLNRYKPLTEGYKRHFTILIEKHGFYPSFNEESSISKFLSSIDKLIEDVVLKADRLEKMKQASLQKMFPRPGATAPEIRFDGFSGDWQTASFSDVFTQLKNNTLSRACLNYESGTIKNIHYGDVLIKFDSVVDVNSSMVPYINNNIDIELNSFNTLSNGDIIFADTAEDEAVGKCVEIEGADVFDAVSGLHTIAVRPTIEFAQYYLGYFLNSNSYHSQLLPLMQGIKVLSIGRYAMADTKVLYPKSLDEQKAIGEYFRNLDSLLSAKRQKLVKLRNIKQACLDKMFVNTSDL